MSEFMRIAFPAWPGTTITDEDGTEPVVGWVTTEDDGLAAILMSGQRRMIGEYSISLPDGSEFQSPLTRQIKRREAEVNEGDGQQRSFAQTSLTPSISFSAKPFATNSWWRYTDGSFDFMFEVPAQQDAPKKTDECQKIKRTEFVDWKADGVPVELYIDVKEGRVSPNGALSENDGGGEEDEDLI